MKQLEFYHLAPQGFSKQELLLFKLKNFQTISNL
jgi:hypothetical protein